MDSRLTNRSNRHERQIKIYIDTAIRKPTYAVRDQKMVGEKGGAIPCSDILIYLISKCRLGTVHRERSIRKGIARFIT
jgi:hypothetical protein